MPAKRISYIIGFAVINNTCEEYVEKLVKEFNFKHYPKFEYSIICGNDNKKSTITAPTRDRLSLLIKENQRAIKFQEVICEKYDENEIKLTQHDFSGTSKFIFNNKVFFDDLIFSISKKYV